MTLPNAPRRSNPLGGRSSRRPATLVALSAATALLAAGCGGGDDDEPASGPEKQGVSASTTLSAVSALSGLTLSADQAERGVVAVKIDNSASSAPQLGLGGADLVTEELVEGGITRLAVFFQSRLPKDVGPVRSMRASDIGIVQPAGATLVASGGAGVTVKRIHDAGITAFTENAAGFHRVSDRSAPYNLFLQLPELARRAGDPPAQPYLPFGDGGLPRGSAASGLTASFSQSSATSFAYRQGRYVNTDSNAAENDRFVPATVLVLRVQVGDAGYRDPAGNPVPETKFTGSGSAMVFHGGRVVRATWTKDGYDAPVTLSTGPKASAQELQLPPGKVWIELVPVDGGGVTVQK